MNMIKVIIIALGQQHRVDGLTMRPTKRVLKGSLRIFGSLFGSPSEKKIMMQKCMYMPNGQGAYQYIWNVLQENGPCGCIYIYSVQIKTIYMYLPKY